MTERFTEIELEAYLDEALTPSIMAEVEESLRTDTAVSELLRAIIARRDAGMHSIGAVWRRHRISCPDRSQLGSFLLGALSQEHSDYIKFHIEKIGCRVCQANLEDLERQQEESSDATTSRRHKYFQSSAGYLSPDDDE
jgi:hypothetical protein